MGTDDRRASTQNSRFINAQRSAIYRAFTDPEALVAWQAPGNMTAKVHAFDARPGGGYRMSLFYPTSEEGSPGKSAEREDRYRARFVELSPERIVEAITFETDDPAFAGEMTMVITLAAQDGGIDVTIRFEDLPPGIAPADNEAGTRSSLEKLARFVEDGRFVSDPVDRP